MGHNAFLRWKALQEVAFVDPEDGKVKIWSESNVSEDFDMALRLMLRGWDVRWATYSRGGFKEGRFSFFLSLIMELMDTGRRFALGGRRVESMAKVCVWM